MTKKYKKLNGHTVTRQNGSHFIVKNDSGKYAYVTRNNGQYLSPNYRVSGQWFGTLDYVAQWVSYTTARLRFLAEIIVE